DHGKLDSVIDRIALGLLAIRPDRDPDDLEVVFAPKLGDSREGVADRNRDVARRVEEIDDQALADPRRDVEALVVERPTRERGQRPLRARGLLRLGPVRARRIRRRILAVAREGGPDCEEYANEGPHP